MKKSLIMVVLSVVFGVVLAMADDFPKGSLSEKMLRNAYMKSLGNAAILANGKKSDVVFLKAAAESSAGVLRMELGSINLYTQKLNIYGKTFESTITWKNIVYKLENILNEQTNHKDLFMEMYKIITCRFDSYAFDHTILFELNSRLIIEEKDNKALLAISALKLYLMGNDNKEHAIRNLVMYYLYLNGDKNAKKYFEKRGYFEHWRKVSNFIDKIERGS